MAGLSLRHIYKRYGVKRKFSLIKLIKNKGKRTEQPKEFVAVKDFNMEIEDGEFIVFVGPSGCGKSTTLRMIAGLEDISDGELYIGDTLVNDIDPKSRDIAMVFQSYALYPHMTAYSNIAFGLKMKKVPQTVTDKNGRERVKMRHMTKAEIDEKVNWAAQVLNIEEQLNKKPGEMSGGQRQRIALGRAIVRNPKVFLLDEPLSNLDAKLRATMRAEIVKLHKKLKTTFIYVTHDQVEAMTMGTRIVVMKLGVVQQIDTPTNLFDYPDNKFVAGFIGTPQMNFFDVTIRKSGDVLKTTFENGQPIDYKLSELRKIEEKYLDGEEHRIVLGVRGEKIELAKNGLQTELTIKEVLGDTTQLFVHLTEDSKDFVVCVSGRVDFNSGDKVCVKFTEKNIHMFDVETE
ncbi:MAG: ATP-binding cassette domain-containing protein, partial [Clostridia bacterium]|nr:ATP-binding cassette domain-containing protein [Clostridia bacterium]